MTQGSTKFFTPLLFFVFVGVGIGAWGPDFLIRQAQAVTIALTRSDQLGNSAFPYAIPLNVQGLEIPPGGQDDRYRRPDDNRTHSHLQPWLLR